MALLPNIEAYPKTVMLQDGTQAQIKPLEEGDKLRLLRFFERVPASVVGFWAALPTRWSDTPKARS